MTATISKGTLNLRFMQNAQNAEKNHVNESIESLVQDESRWEVAKEVRDAWGMMGSEPPSSLAVIHEASYLPFVFSGCNDASGSPQEAVKLRGRRTWNKRGQEVTEGELQSLDDSRGSPSARQVPTEEQQRQHHNHNTSKRLTSISSFGPRSSSTKDIERAKPRNTKSAREIIREDVVVGSGIKIRNLETEEEDKSSGDCSLPSRSALPPPPSAPSPHMATSSLSTRDKFLKPAGVDEPSDFVSRGDGSRPARPETDTIRGTRRPNLKRDRDDRRREDAGAQTTTTSSRKRRKSGAAAAA
ncbi:hypothetical protein BJY52DRAFT_944054 [Lactarius psammicola]|nr:hypothetical protein BJY52DRAFT_944054 [Lactarius psammicola]